MSVNTPNFLGIGAQRAATTWLHGCLSNHPALCLPEKKEVHYFNRNYEKGMDWYVSHFNKCGECIIKGEITPNYLQSELAASRIARDFPDIKMFVILRDPLIRARSAYELLENVSQRKPFVEECVVGSYLVEGSLYGKHISRFMRYFEKNQIKIFLYEDITERPRECLNSLCSFLDVDQMPLDMNVSAKTNSIIFPGAQKLLSDLRLSRVIELAKTEPLGGILRKYAASKKASDRHRQSICLSYEVCELIRRDILLLEDLIDRDLKNWINTLNSVTQ